MGAYLMSADTYGLKWPNETTQLEREMWFIKSGGLHTKKDGSTYGLGLSEHFHRMRKIIWPELDDETSGQRWHKVCRDTILSSPITVLMGPACVAGETRILNPLTGKSPTIEHLFRNGIAPTVMTLYGPEQASVPFIKGFAQLYRVKLSDGSSFLATAQHRVLTALGFRHVEDVKIGQCLFSYVIQPRGQYAKMGSGKVVDSMACCSPYPRPGGELLHRAREACQVPSPLPAGVQTYNPYYSGVGGSDQSSGIAPPASLGRGGRMSPCLSIGMAQVLSITKAGKDVYYDLTVPRAAHYFAEGAIHHNSTGKTHEPAWLFLCDWMCLPNDTCVLVSSTDMRGLRLRVWGEIVSLWERAVERFPELPGHLIDSKLAITAESVMEDGEINDRTARDFRSAIIGIPTIQGGKFVGLGKFVGIKQKRVRLIADEAAQMGGGFLSAFSNLNKNPDFRAVVIGNPNDPLDCLGRAAEPRDGWDGHMEPTKTEVWDTRFMDGKCCNLIGTDSPNNDFPEDKKPRFPYLIHKRKIDETAAFFGRESYEFYSQSVGAMKIATLSRRILTRRMCEDNNALLPHCDWQRGNRTSIGGLDAAYGGDRTVFIHAEFGMSVDGKVRLLLHPPALVPISPKSPLEPEDQIAAFVKRECEGLGITPGNFFHDSTGRGSLGTALARAWSAECNPVEFGGVPSKRPVSLDHYVTDRAKNTRRLVLCDEFYTHKIAELWFSVRYCVEAGQLRGLTPETMDEGCMREWRQEKNDKRSIETKTEMKVRLGRSPDLMDAVAIVVEGARRKGFQISKLANESPNKSRSDDYLRGVARQQREMLRAKELVPT